MGQSLSARRAVGEIWSTLETQGQTGLQSKVDELQGWLTSAELLESLPSIEKSTREILGAFRALYEARHADRSDQFGAAIEKIKGREEWTALPETMRGPVLHPLKSRCC